jgi:hypothetical protein
MGNTMMGAWSALRATILTLVTFFSTAVASLRKKFSSWYRELRLLGNRQAVSSSAPTNSPSVEVGPPPPPTSPSPPSNSTPTVSPLPSPSHPPVESSPSKTDPLFVDLYAGDKPDLKYEDWLRLATDPRFIGGIIKATEGLYYDGGTWFVRNWLNSGAVGRVIDRFWFRGCYHYLKFNYDGAKQADFYAKCGF